MLQFDQESARRLACTAEAVLSAVQTQRRLLDVAIGSALREFRGPYGRVFEENCRSDSADYGVLMRALGRLADDVEIAAHQARRELERLQELAAWQVREDARDERRRQSAAVGVPMVEDVIVDRMPSDVPFATPEVSVAFTPVPRLRGSRGGQAGVSSADPENLRVFVTQANAVAPALDDALARLHSHWVNFTSSCGWVQTGSSTFLSGFEYLVQEERADAAWIEQIANAFEAAGGGSLSVRALDVVAPPLAPMDERRLLRALSDLPADELTALFAASPDLAARVGRISPATVSTWWAGLAPGDASAGFSDRQKLLLSTLPTLLGNLEGLPYGARDRANRIGLQRDLDATAKEIEETERMLAVASVAAAVTANLAVVAALEAKLQPMKERQTCLEAIDATLGAAQKDSPRFLISLTADQPPLAAVSIGDLDTASDVSFTVPGMGTTTKDMETWATGAQTVQTLRGKGSAVVAWIGYKTPPIPSPPVLDLSVLGIADAEAGGAALASALKGLDVVRRERPPHLGVIAHSFGSTAAAITMTDPGVHVDTFVTLGSAGLPNWITSADQLHADKVYAGQASDRKWGDPGPGDEASWIGREFSPWHGVNPADPAFGAHVFGVETGGDAGLPVTKHDAVAGEATDDRGYLDRGTECSRNVDWALQGLDEKLTPPSPPRKRVPPAPVLPPSPWNSSHG
ncbi:arginine exporter protein ArgO [Rathayibacter agropyri]